MIKIWLPIAIILICVGAWPIGFGVIICGTCINIYEKIQKEKKMQDEIKNLKKEIENLKSKN